MISAVPPSSNSVTIEDDEEKEIVEGLRKSRGAFVFQNYLVISILEPPRIVRRIFVRRDHTGQILVDKSKLL